MPGSLAVHHIGIAVRSIDEAMQFYADKLGLSEVDTLELTDRQLKVTFVSAGNVLLELLEPLDPDTPVARFLERRGPGLHHLCFESQDIDEHLRDLQARGIELIDQQPRPGAHGQVAFLQPTAGLGVLVELLQPPGPDATRIAARAQGAAELEPEHAAASGPEAPRYTTSAPETASHAAGGPEPAQDTSGGPEAAQHMSGGPEQERHASGGGPAAEQ